MNKNIIKDYSRKISERMWNLPEKGELESHREKTYIDDIIHKSHIERKLASSNNLASLKSSITFWHSAYYPIYILGFYSFHSNPDDKYSTNKTENYINFVTFSQITSYYNMNTHGRRVKHDRQGSLSSSAKWQPVGVK